MSPTRQPTELADIGHEYQGVVADGRRWRSIQHRPGDIVITTPSKSGTTWLQMLVALLIFRTHDFPAPLGDISPWYDALFTPLDVINERLEAQDHRRFIKTHIPLDGLPLFEEVTYLVIGRDPRDVWVSMNHHVMNIGTASRELLNANVSDFTEYVKTVELPELPEEPAEAFRAQMDLDPGHNQTAVHLAFVVHHLRLAWARRHEPNVAVFHYADLGRDLIGQMARLAEVLKIEIGSDEVAELAEHASLAAMRANATMRAPEASHDIWVDPAAFFRNGGSGDWESLSTPETMSHYYHRLDELTEGDHEFIDWLHHGFLSRGE